MNREELEKMFNNKFKELGIESDLHQRGALRDFIFDTIIPEVLKSILIQKSEIFNNPYADYYNSIVKIQNDYVDILKQKAKELYYINL